MRKIININKDWQFIKKNIGAAEAQKAFGTRVDIPHTWNGHDGQDGKNDYYRGRCWYRREFDAPEVPQGGAVYVEFKGVNSSASVFVNGESAGSHDGGYSTFRFNITELIKEKNILTVCADNSKNETVYPQTADFTFYGGIYRDVSLIVVPGNHFDLDHYGSCGLEISAGVNGGDGCAEVKARVKGEGDVQITIYGADGNIAASGAADAPIKVEKARLWDGVKDPYLYTLKAQLVLNGEVCDEIVKRIGFRDFRFDPGKGFILNGREYPLRGVCRHQDRPGIGNALNRAHHEEDIALIRETGANTVRLAHYQHDDYFYELCDECGLTVWAEIPYISRHMNGADENAKQQMLELISQLRHHPGIICWGLSNEITIHRAGNDRYDFHLQLNQLCHEKDPSRPTVIACYMPCMVTNKLNRIPDLVSYNLYFGWYFPVTALAGWKLDRFHKKYPDTPLGLSEYGAEAMPNLHSKRARRMDNTEEYQCVYHERMLKIINARNYLWGTHLWNMFDFAADARNQGGEPGMNHKGLVTFDRKTKKDSFYLYKAYWSAEKFVHIASKRFVNRTGETMKIKVYSNCGEVSLYNNGSLIGTVKGDKVFGFTVRLESSNEIVAKSGEYSDKAVFLKAEKPDRSYKLRKGGTGKSWEK